MSTEMSTAGVPAVESLCIRDLEVTFTAPGGDIRAVQGVNLEVAPGECVGVVGESGAGKSQIFLAALGLLSANGRARGSVRLGTTELLGSSARELDRIRGARIAMIFQDPMTSLTPHLRIAAQIAEPLVRHGRSSWRDARRRALELLQRVQMSEPERRLQQYPHELSGGMRQRASIAIALACQPAVLIADEPTTALDVTVQAQILALLAELKRSQGMSLVLITHDLGAVAGLADRIAVMQAGRIVESAQARTLMKSPQHPYTRALLAAVPRIDPLPSDPGSPHPSCGFAPAAACVSQAIDATATLQLDSVDVQFPVHAGRGWRAQPLRALQGVSLVLNSGEALGIVGESGSGKSTLARAALHLLGVSTGRIAWLGQPLLGLAAAHLRQMRRDIQIIFQDPLASLDPRMRVSAQLSEPLSVHRPELSEAGRSRVVAEALERVGLASSLLQRYPHELSGGQCQRVGIARAMVLEPRVLVCDEAVSALDVTVQEQIVQLLDSLKRERGVSILFISHNLAVVRRLCDRILVLYLGRMMELAPVRAIYARPRHPYTRELLDSAPIADPDVQPQRLQRVRAGEAPSPFDPPSGCVYRTRCAYAIRECASQQPRWEPTPEEGQVACIRWRELALDGS